MQLDHPSAVEALDAAYDRHFADLVRLTRALGAGHEAEDLAQEVLLYARSHLWQLRDPGKLTGWLRAIAARKAFSNRFATQPKFDARVFVPADPDLRMDIADAICRLPARERAAVTLVYMLGYSEDATAEVLGVRRGTIAASLSHARSKLASWLIEYERGRGR